MKDRLRAGMPAPDVQLHRPDGTVVTTSDLWRRGLLIVAFLRHFG